MRDADADTAFGTGVLTVKTGEFTGDVTVLSGAVTVLNGEVTDCALWTSDASMGFMKCNEVSSMLMRGWVQ